MDDDAVLDFFQTSSRNLLAAEAAAGVNHHVVLSIVGADRLPESGYLRAKVAQEEAVKAGTVPYTIVRAAQFFEFIGRLADSSSAGEAIHLAPVFVQPESADDLAATLWDVVVNEPVNGIVELAGPEEFRLDELVRRVLSANNDARKGDRRHPRTLLRREARLLLPDPRGPRTHRPDPLRRLAQPVRSPVNALAIQRRSACADRHAWTGSRELSSARSRR
jgi:uncharacterized protein YbjT (DUF2867 family)